VVIEPLTAPMREFLVWVARCPRSYADAIEAWGSHCPRYTVWEDALAAGLVEIDHRAEWSIDRAPIRLTSLGRSALPD
jgi:hypothetical protein